MKKKLFLTLVISILCLVAFAFAVAAKDVDIKINDVSGNPIILPTVDADGDPLTWYRITDRPTDTVYFEYVDGNTTYYIVSVKTKDAAYVNDSYRVAYSYPGLKTGAWNSNIIATNIEGITHEDGKGPEYYDFVFEGTPICYAYIPASMLALKGQHGNSKRSLFYACPSLVEVEFESGSKIEELDGNGFYNCKKLSYIRLPENLKTINAGAFVGINPTIVVPKSVTTFEASNWSNPTVLFTGTASDHAGWSYQPSITYVEHCDVYHGGTHAPSEDDFDCTTALLCANCGKKLAEAQSNHKIVTDYGYLNGFSDEGFYESKCQNAGCAYVEESKKLDPLFTNLGFSAAEYSGGGMSIGFKVDKDAILAYEEATGEKVNYGVFAVLAEKIGTNDIFDADGKALDGVIAADITDTDFDIFNLKIVGFTGDQVDTKLAMGAYVGTTKDGKTEYAYLQGGTPETGAKYFFASYTDVKVIVDAKNGVSAQ